MSNIDSLVNVDVREAVSLVRENPDIFNIDIVRFAGNFDEFQAELKELEEVLSKNGGINGYFGKMPRQQYLNYKVRIAEIKTGMLALKKLIKSLEAGFDPYVINPKWYIGNIVPMSYSWQNPIKINSVFKAPIPLAALERYNLAQQLGIFDHFVVAAPDWNLFERVPLILDDPVLVGFISTTSSFSISNLSSMYSYNFLAIGVVSMLIAQ